MAKLGALQTERIRRNYLYGDLSARQLIDLLEDKVAPGAARASRELVRLMEDYKHRNLAAHTKGSKDETTHYTVFVNGKGHHLRLDSRGIVFQITDNSVGHDLGEVPPWTKPGAQ